VVPRHKMRGKALVGSGARGRDNSPLWKLCPDQLKARLRTMSIPELKQAIIALQTDDGKHRREIDTLKKRLGKAEAKVTKAQTEAAEALKTLTETVEQLGGIENALEAIKGDTAEIKTLKSLLEKLKNGITDLKEGQNFTVEEIRALLWFSKQVDASRPAHIQPEK